MNKQDIEEIFQGTLAELDDFEKNIKMIRQLIKLIIDNFDLLKDDVTDDQVAEVSSEIKVKASKIVAMLMDVLSDAKKLESFIHEIKLLKRKREKKLVKKPDKPDLDNFDEIFKQLIDMEELKKQKKTNPYNPYDPKTNPPYIFPKKGGGGIIF